jgi:hypothetical protein
MERVKDWVSKIKNKRSYSYRYYSRFYKRYAARYKRYLDYTLKLPPFAMSLGATKEPTTLFLNQ